MLTFNDILKKHNPHTPFLYGISQRCFFPSLEPLQYLELLFETSADVIQWRERDIPAEQNRVYIRRGAELSKKSGKLFLVNSLITIGIQEGIGGVHLTSDQDMKWATEIRLAADLDEFVIGKSVHSLAEAVQAESEGADYVLLGPIFAPLSKSTTMFPLGGSILLEISQILNIPVVVVGGLDHSNFQEVSKKGIAGVAGITWVQNEIGKFLKKQ